MKKILITGGAGFIGSNFIRYVIGKYPDYKIINLDKLTYCGNLDNLKDIESKNYTFIKGDICNAKLVEKAARGCECVINFAASTHVDRSILDAGDFIQTNIYGTNVLLEAAKKYKVARYIQISTDEVYGSTLKDSFKESSPLEPNSPYSASKAAADLLVKAYYATHKIPAIITRSSNNFGPYQYPEKLIPLFITNAYEDKKLPLYGDGKNVRDWIHVIDNCRAIDTVWHKGKVGEVYNIGAGNEETNIKITTLILKYIGKSRKLIKYVSDRLGHDRRYSLDCSKLKKLGWKPEYEFEDALAETVDWFLSNEKWWRKIKKRKQCYRKYYSKQYGSLK
ncbi:MAG: dTDP-glucose 4,6-dehydratase [Candidatus Omnitrophica bacterium]|nr:dTDP-glucose 4,6-dehydratase [Candidatus Omnitrophota bacterium]